MLLPRRRPLLPPQQPTILCFQKLQSMLIGCIEILYPKILLVDIDALIHQMQNVFIAHLLNPNPNNPLKKYVALTRPSVFTSFYTCPFHHSTYTHLLPSLPHPLFTLTHTLPLAYSHHASCLPSTIITAPQTTGTGKKIKWLCTHPPGAKCVNCMRPPKKNASYKCTHPSCINTQPYPTPLSCADFSDNQDMTCPNCSGGEKEADTNKVCNVFLNTTTTF